MDQVEDVASILTHDELLEITQSSLCTLLSCDPLLNDLPSDIIIEEVLSQIAVEHGQAITIFISRESEPVLKVIYLPYIDSDNKYILQVFAKFMVCMPNITMGHAYHKVPQTVSVRDLKKATARHFELFQKRTGSKVKISWKYIWKTYDLCYDSIILDNDDHCIQDYGVCNKVTLTFKKKKKKIHST